MAFEYITFLDRNPAKILVEAGIGVNVRVWGLCCSFANVKEKGTHEPAGSKEFLFTLRYNPFLAFVA